MESNKSYIIAKFSQSWYVSSSFILSSAPLRYQNPKSSKIIPNLHRKNRSLPTSQHVCLVEASRLRLIPISQNTLFSIIWRYSYVEYWIEQHDSRGDLSTGWGYCSATCCSGLSCGIHAGKAYLQTWMTYLRTWLLWWPACQATLVPEANELQGLVSMAQ